MNLNNRFKGENLELTRMWGRGGGRKTSGQCDTRLVRATRLYASELRSLRSF